MALIIMSQIVYGQKSEMVEMQFSTNCKTIYYENNESQNVTSQKIVISENKLTFIPEYGEFWTEKIAERDTFINNNNERTVQLWTENSYWEIIQQKKKGDESYRTYFIYEWPYFGQVDKVVYQMKPQQK